MSSCKYCGSAPADWLTLDVSRVGDSSAFRLFPTQYGPEASLGTFGPRDVPVERWHICRFGHMTATDDADALPRPGLAVRLLRRLFEQPPPDPDLASPEEPNVVRLLGSTGGGKSQLVRALRQETVPPPPALDTTGTSATITRTVYREPRIEEGARMGSGQLPPTIDFKQTVRERLLEFLMDHAVDAAAVSDMLSRSLMAALAREYEGADQTRVAEREWGLARAPYVLTSRLRTTRRTRRVMTPVVDLPGEVIDRLMRLGAGSRLGRSEIQQLNYSHHFLAVVDATSLSGLYHALTEPERLAAMRDNVGGTDAGHRETAKQAEALLGTILHMTTQIPALAHAKVTVALTKSDSIHRALHKSPPGTSADPLARWGWCFSGTHRREDFIATAADALTNWAGLDGDVGSAATQLLAPLASAGRDRTGLARELAVDILNHFGEPDAFWGLVASDQHLELEVAGRRVRVEDSNTYWFHNVAGRTLQTRDVVAGVVACALLGAEFGRNTVTELLASSEPLFVLTCTREFITADGELRGPDEGSARLRSNAGMLQLMARLLQETRDD